MALRKVKVREGDLRQKLLSALQKHTDRDGSLIYSDGMKGSTLQEHLQWFFGEQHTRPLDFGETIKFGDFISLSCFFSESFLEMASSKTGVSKDDLKKHMVQVKSSEAGGSNGGVALTEKWMQFDP